MYLKFIRKNPKNPVLISVPHAGNFYPELFLKYLKLNLNEVRKIEDFKSDEILNLINKDSADVIIAQCSRAVIDLNRSRKAIDNNMFTEIFEKKNIDEKKMIEFGLGVFPKSISNNQIYNKKLPISYGKYILETFYDPFHKILSAQIKNLLNKFGNCYHFDLHTMPSKALKNFKNEPDIVLGNNFGKSCSIELLNYIKNNFKIFGLNVEVNNPYAGGFITRNYGNPSIGVETLQIEINRKLYMHEERLSLNNINLIQEIFSNIFNNFNYYSKLAAE